MLQRDDKAGPPSSSSSRRRVDYNALTHLISVVAEELDHLIKFVSHSSDFQKLNVL